MKRLSTLVLTACIALAASALVPQPMVPVPVATPSPTLQSALRTPASPTTSPAKAPQGLDQVVEIEAKIHTVEYYPNTQSWYIYVMDEDLIYDIRFDYNSTNTTDPTGTYNTEDFNAKYSYMYEYADGGRTAITYQEITLTLTGSNKAGYELNAEIKGSNDKIYKVHALKAGIPAVTEVINITTTNLSFDESRVSNGALFAFAQDDTYWVSIQLAVNTIGDYYNATFPTTTVAGYIVNLLTNEQIILDVADALLETKIDGRTESLKGYIVDASGVQYNFDLSYTEAAPTYFYDVDFTELTPLGFFDGFEYLWEAQMYAPAELLPEGYDILALNLALMTTTLEGEFASSAYDRTYTMLGYIDSRGINETQFVDLKAVNNTKVTFDPATGYHHLTAEVVTRTGIQYNVKMFGLLGYMAGDALEGEVTRAYTADDKLEVASEAYPAYNFYAIYADIKTDKDILGLQFVVAQPDAKLVLPAGEYPISHNVAVGNVMASTGYSNGMPTYSLYATLTEQGTLRQSYYLTSGKVVVEHRDEALYIEVDAQNSAGVPVKITYDGKAEPTALDNTSADTPQARKIIAPDGQLRILRGEQVYDATGARLQ